MTSSNNETNAAANTTLVAATPVLEAESPNTVLSPWDSEIVDLLEEVAQNTEGLTNEVSVQVTEPTAETTSPVILPVVEQATSMTVVPEAAQLSAPSTVTLQENQPQPEVVAATPAEAGQHSLAGLQAIHSTSDEAQTTPIATNENTTAANTSANTTRQSTPIRLANGQFASRAQLSTQFGKLQASMGSHQGDLTGYALGGGLWSVAKETMGFMHHAQGLFNRVRRDRANTNSTQNRTNSRASRPNRQAANTTQATTTNRENTTHSNTTQAENTASVANVSSTTQAQPSTTNDQRPNQPDRAQAAPVIPPASETPQLSAGQQQQAEVQAQVHQSQQQQLVSDQLERQTFSLISEERNTQQLLQNISSQLAQQASCCCRSDGLDTDQRSDDQDNNRRRNNRRRRWLPKLGKLAKFGGPVAGIVTAATTYGALQNREDLSVPQKVVQVGASTTGTMGGAAAGAMAGASLGSVVPLLGTTVGGLIGGIIGGVAGNWLGDLAGQTASDYLAEKEKPTTAAVSVLDIPKAGAQTIEVDHSELQFKDTDKLVVNTATTSQHQGRISSTTIAEPIAADVNQHSSPVDPAPLNIYDRPSTAVEGHDYINTAVANSPSPTITLDEQKLGQALAKSLQQFPTTRAVQPTAMSSSASPEFSSIPTEFDDVVLTLMSHDRI
ncbi:hypothetical protein [Spartinivicinus poritis]|uniref:Glycine zipper domain-containing protein n=1 Tax=Spartinivicinus poritis TaxID=2994640 RepID=A0ABT5UFC2_9GAMM|nr:hypothetical protein [Spartinivicinus sp. A2-2]MDE1465093.1 hypothetical protein [Spartinivicinus sp. A2-2]